MSNFKKVLKTTLLFLVIWGIMSAFIMELFFSSENFYYQDAKERTELSGTVNFLICGASHAMRGFRPDVIDEELSVNSYNMSCSRLTMRGRYELLELELNRNPVDTLILELSYDSLTRNRDTEGPEGDIYLLAKLDGFIPRMKYFFSEVRLSEYSRMYYEYIDNGVKCLKKLLTGNFKTSNEKLYKGYAAYKRENIKLSSSLKKIYNTNVFDETIYEPNIEYLDKIIALCKEKGIRLMMVTTPLSKVTVCRYSNLDVFREKYVEIAKENNLEYYDFNLLVDKDELFPDETAFSDRFHLSNDGAEIFTRYFTDFIQKVDAGENVDDLFYSSYAEVDQNEDYSK